jgi:uncharacterized protein (DUF1330 family)
MKYYFVVELDITDQSWVSDYIQNVTRIVERRGGRYLARTSKIDRIEGQRRLPQVFLILEWPSKESAEAFYRSEEYQPYLKSRIAGSKSEFLLVAGEDVAKVAKME